MNWEAVSAIAEIVGVLLVVASLVYLARQLGQNTAMMRVSAAGERLERDYELVLPLIENREFAEVWAKGDCEFDSLDAADQQRLLFFERRAITLWHHMYQLRMQDLLPDANWYENEWVIQNIGRRQAIREAWRVFGSAFEKSFHEYIDGQFELGDNSRSES